MAKQTPVDQAVEAVAETLITAHRQGDVAAITNALSSPVLHELDERYPGLGNIHLVFAFARLLSHECPPETRDHNGVPQLSRLIGDEITERDYVAERKAAGEAFGRPISTADAKASGARYADAVPLAQELIRIWILAPDAIPEFVHTHSGRSPTMVNDVWGVLWHACATIRASAEAADSAGRVIPDHIRETLARTRTETERDTGSGDRQRRRAGGERDGRPPPGTDCGRDDGLS